MQSKPNTFFSRLSYSFGNEDWESERKALRIQPGNRVFCITASGDRPLHLLLDDCSEVVSIDANPIQNYLMNLKCAAMKHLEYQDYLSFLGGSQGTRRNETLKKIIPHMDKEAAAFWMQNPKMVEEGVLYQGAVERWLQRAAILMRLFRGRKLKRLFAMDNLEEQRVFLDEEWNTVIWKKLFDLALNPRLTQLFLRDPGLYENLDPGIRPGTYILNRMNACMHRFLAKESQMMSLIFRGTVSKEAYPPYLTQEGTEKIKPRIDRVKVETADVVSFLEKAKDESFDCFSLSDVASYLCKEDFHRVIKAIYRTARPGARFSIREFLSGHKMPAEVAPFFQREPELEEQLQANDRFFVYRFMVGKIIKN